MTKNMKKRQESKEKLKILKKKFEEDRKPPVVKRACLLSFICKLFRTRN